MKINQKVFISLLIFFLSEHILNKTTYGMTPRPKFEEFVEKIKNEKMGPDQKIQLNIPTFEELEKKDPHGDNILHIAVKSEHYGILKYILEAFINFKKNEELKKILGSKNSLGKTPLRLALDLNKMSYTQLLASFENKAQTNILKNDELLFLDALKIKNPDSINDFYDFLKYLKVNIKELNPDENDSKKLLLKQDDQGNTIYHLILQNKILTTRQKTILFQYCWFDDFDISLQNSDKKSILDYAVLISSKEIENMFRRLDLELPLKLAILKNNLEKLKLKLISLQSSLRKLQGSLEKT
jgi:ankyrin repeat protein